VVRRWTIFTNSISCQPTLMRALLRRGRTPAGMGLHPTTFEIPRLSRLGVALSTSDLVPADSVRPDSPTTSAAASPRRAAGRRPSRLAGPEQPHHVCPSSIAPLGDGGAAELVSAPPTHARAARNLTQVQAALWHPLPNLQSAFPLEPPAQPQFPNQCSGAVSP
jgi:hypothetical protein